jgi:hypothetical protein
MVFGPSPETIQYTQELEKFPQWKGNVPSYAAAALVNIIS